MARRGRLIPGNWESGEHERLGSPGERIRHSARVMDLPEDPRCWSLEKEGFNLEISTVREVERNLEKRWARICMQRLALKGKVSAELVECGWDLEEYGDKVGKPTGGGNLHTAYLRNLLSGRAVDEKVMLRRKIGSGRCRLCDCEDGSWEHYVWDCTGGPGG